MASAVHSCYLLLYSYMTAICVYCVSFMCVYGCARATLLLASLRRRYCLLGPCGPNGIVVSSVRYIVDVSTACKHFTYIHWQMHTYNV